jgi:adenylate kinase family enzyme
LNRIAIVGSGGSGKSVLAVQLGGILNIPVFHLDRYFWKPGWEMVNRSTWLEIIQNLVQNEKWIIDGNYKSTMNIRFPLADTIIFLDFKKYRCLFNILKRFLKYYRKFRPDMGIGCSEKLDFEYIKWVWDYPRRSRGITYENLKLYGNGKNIYILKNRREVKEFLNSVRFQPVLQP